MAGFRDVPGTNYRVGPMSAGQMIAMEQAGVDGIAGLVRLAHFSTANGDGNPVWPTYDDACAAPWPTVKACADEALIVNGLSGEDISGN